MLVSGNRGGAVGPHFMLGANRALRSCGTRLRSATSASQANRTISDVESRPDARRPQDRLPILGFMPAPIVGGHFMTHATLCRRWYPCSFYAGIAEVLLKAGANEPINDCLTSATPAHKACYAGRTEALKVLVALAPNLDLHEARCWLPASRPETGCESATRRFVARAQSPH